MQRSCNNFRIKFTFQIGFFRDFGLFSLRYILQLDRKWNTCNVSTATIDIIYCWFWMLFWKGRFGALGMIILLIWTRLVSFISWLIAFGWQGIKLWCRILLGPAEWNCLHCAFQQQKHWTPRVSLENECGGNQSYIEICVLLSRSGCNCIAYPCMLLWWQL